MEVRGMRKMKTKKKRSAPEAIARLTIYGAAEMELVGRVQLAEWLHRCADNLTVEGPGYARRFVARYLKK